MRRRVTARTARKTCKTHHAATKKPPAAGMQGVACGPFAAPPLIVWAGSADADYCFTASICTTRRTFLGKPHSTP